MQWWIPDGTSESPANDRAFETSKIQAGHHKSAARIESKEGVGAGAKKIGGTEGQLLSSEIGPRWQIFARSTVSLQRLLWRGYDEQLEKHIKIKRQKCAPRRILRRPKPNIKRRAHRKAESKGRGWIHCALAKAKKVVHRRKYIRFIPKIILWSKWKSW